MKSPRLELVLKLFMVGFVLFHVASITSAFAQESPDKLQNEVTQGIRLNELNEGTEVQIDPKVLEDLKPWLSNSRLTLEDLLEEVCSLRPIEAKETMVSVIRQVIFSSAPNGAELLMRYVLNRTLKIIEIMDETQSLVDPIPESLIQENRMLRESILVALEFYESDLKYLSGQSSARRPIERAEGVVFSPPFAKFGIGYASKVFQTNESFKNPRGRYKVGYFLLGLLSVDLSRDRDAKIFASEIQRIRIFLDQHPQDPRSTDAELIALSRAQRDIIEKVIRGVETSTNERDQELQRQWNQDRVEGLVRECSEYDQIDCSREDKCKVLQRNHHCAMDDTRSGLKGDVRPGKRVMVFDRSRGSGVVLVQAVFEDGSILATTGEIYQEGKYKKLIKMSESINGLSPGVRALYWNGIQTLLTTAYEVSENGEILAENGEIIYSRNINGGEVPVYGQVRAGSVVIDKSVLGIGERLVRVKHVFWGGAIWTECGKPILRYAYKRPGGF